MILLLADLNDLEVKVAYIGNACLHGKTRDELYTKIDIEGNICKGNLIIDKSHYGLKTSANRCHENSYYANEVSDLQKQTLTFELKISPHTKHICSICG